MSALNKLLPAILLAYVADVPCTLTADECNELSKFVARLELEIERLTAEDKRATAEVARLVAERAAVVQWQADAEKVCKALRVEIEEMKAANRWIPVEERLPPEAGFYEVFVPEWEGYGNVAHVDICWYACGNCWEQGNFPSVDDGAPVSHWRPILPPKEG